MRTRLIALTIALLVAAGAAAQTIEGKKVVGGHGYAMYSTYTLRQRMAGMQNVPLDGIMVAVNRNDLAGDPEKRMMRPLRWFKPPAVTIGDFSIALDDLANTDFGRFKHNILWTGGTRSLGVNFFDDERWESVVCNNARVMAEICNRVGFEAVWFDVEVGGSPGGGYLTWNSPYFKDKHPFEEYQAQARKCGRKLMEAFTSVKPDFKLIISHAYGPVLRALAGRDPGEALPEISYSLLPSFLDGMLEGCGERGQVIDSGEGTYGAMTYAAFKAWREWDMLAAEKLSDVPHLLSKSYRHAMAMWPDFRSDSNGWNADDFEKNHFSPDRMKHALHNAMAASDEFVWTYTQHAHWWPHHLEIWPFHMGGLAAPPASRVHFGEPYFKALADAHTPMDLDWHPERTDETGYEAPQFDAAKVFSPIDSSYELVSDLADGWLFHRADYSTPAAFGWAMPLSTYHQGTEQVYQWRPIQVGDYWENQDVALDGTGVYRLRFTVPEDAREKRLHLALAGVAGRATVYLGHKGLRARSVGRTAGEGLALFDITESVDVEGDNVLSIVVASPSGPGGIYGAVRLFATDKGEDGYVALRGKETGKWFHWIKATRLGNFPGKLAIENTVEARMRVPDEKSFTAHLWASGRVGWHMKFGPTGLTLGEKQIEIDCTRWHTYRVVTARKGESAVHTLFIDGKEAMRTTDVKIQKGTPGKPVESAIGFGHSWGNDSAPPVKMDLDYLRWANRPFTPEDERAAAANLPEAQERKETFWDEAYEGDRLPDSDGWKWWYHHDGRPFTRIVYFREPIDLSDPEKRAVLYDWEARKGATLIPRDVPRLAFTDEVHGKVTPGRIDAGDETFAARLTLWSSKKTNWGWPAIALVDFDTPDWSPYAAFGMTFHNPAKKTQRIGLCVRDGDGQRWGCDETFAPGETITLGATINELRSKLLISDVASITVYSNGPKTAQTFLVSPLYLVK